MRDPSYWSTRDELAFIDGLGKCNWMCEGYQRFSRDWLLYSYYKTLSYREDWGTLDRDKVISHVEMELGI